LKVDAATGPPVEQAVLTSMSTEEARLDKPSNLKRLGSGSSGARVRWHEEIHQPSANSSPPYAGFGPVVDRGPVPFGVILL